MVPNGMIKTAKRHRPAYFTGFPDQVDKFETEDDLRSIDHVRNCSQIDGFYRLSIARGEGQPTLMAEFNGGETWYVLAYLSEDVETLPEWEPVYRS